MEEMSLVESLERVLIGRYRDSDALERLLDHAKFDVKKFDLRGEYPSALNRSLRVVSDQNRLKDIILAALRDNANDVELLKLAEQCEFEGAPTATSIATLMVELREFLILLRRSRHLSRKELNKLDTGLQKMLNLTAMAENDRRDGDTTPDHWDDLSKTLRLCTDQLQLYRELIDESAKPRRERVPGVSDERLTLAEVAADKITLIDTKRQLLDELIMVVRSGQDIDLP